MSNLFDPPAEPVVVIADTGLFVACGRQGNPKYVALERFVQRNDIVFRIPERVYQELGSAPERSTPSETPIDAAIESGWVSIADAPDYTDGTVSSVMDDVRRRIAKASNRPEDTIEKADTALAAVAVEALKRGQAAFVYLVTTDVDAGEASVAAVAAHGFDGQLEVVNGFDLVARLT